MGTFIDSICLYKLVLVLLSPSSFRNSNIQIIRDSTVKYLNIKRVDSNEKWKWDCPQEMELWGEMNEINYSELLMFGVPYFWTEAFQVVNRIWTHI